MLMRHKNFLAWPRGLAHCSPFWLLLLFILILSCQQEVLQESPVTDKGYGISGVGFLVHNLDTIQQHFHKYLGFNFPEEQGVDSSMYPGARTWSATFPDLSGIELVEIYDSLAFADQCSSIQKLTSNHKQVSWYGLSSSSVEKSQKWLNDKEIETDTIRDVRVTKDTPEGWSWDDGGPNAKYLSLNSESQNSILPIFSEWLGFPYEEAQQNWRSYYSSIRHYPYYQHDNGVVALNTIHLVSQDLKSARKKFKSLGFHEVETDGPKNELRFTITEKQTVLISTPVNEKDSLIQWLQKYGDGIYALKFEVVDIDSTKAFFNQKTSVVQVYYDSLRSVLNVESDFGLPMKLEFIQESAEEAYYAKVYKLGEEKMDSVSKAFTADLYKKYCALCHGENREGYAADHAPSLKSHSLIASSMNSNFMRYAISFGRTGTAMAAYSKSQGGPLGWAELELLLEWLKEESGVEKAIELSSDAITGDAVLGEELYGLKCAACHGSKGEGVTAPALGRPMLLATASDAFLKHAISFGRDSTPMIAFKDSLTDKQINALVAFLRSRASGWDIPKAIEMEEPKPEEYLLHPQSKTPEFVLRDGLYLSSDQLDKAIKDSMRLVILDARSKAAWRQTHIPGAVPVPYYTEPDSFIRYMPSDSTWIVTYCACPHAASQKVVTTLRRLGFKKTAILDDGILIWAEKGFPVQNGM